ncbi:MAG: MBL fold metallo-hydrolase [Deltaproteobacteria bacterium]|nr:MBL fold metallo-hydrolase [Deltaproteobacteria bacterium]MBW2578754.1 MBL fold metallo-hydrolase [Deltaproteobacteria bacterium]MBW2691284.1 MBL fold metallo-hydrolase [Deltaproteobacteria bacterium]
MGRKVGVIAVVLVALVGVLAVYLYNRVTVLDHEAVTDSVSVIYGAGGNVAVLRTQSGAVVVDTMTFPIQGRRILVLAERLGGGPTQAVINTHYHADHTHGNPAWPLGTRIVATERTRAYLERFDSAFWEGLTAGAAPNDLFTDRHDLRIGDKTVRSHYLGRGHTGGDLVVLFVEDRVLHTGDLFFNRRYPNIDLEAGGSVQQWAETLERVLALDFDRVIPGHGPVTDRAGLLEFQRFIAELAEFASESAAAEMSLEETLAAANLEHDGAFEELSVPFLFKFDRDFVIRRAWEEASGVVQPVELEAPAASGNL